MADDDELAARKAEMARARDAELNRAYHLLFNSPTGRVVLADLIIYCNGTETTFVPGDSYQTIFLEGRRDALLHIMWLAKISAEEILQFRVGRAVATPGGA